MAGHRLRQKQAALHVGAYFAYHGGEVRVLRLLLEDHERPDNTEARLDHRRELTREDLQRLRLDLLERRARALLAAGRQLFQHIGEQPTYAELLPRRLGVRCMKLAGVLDAVDIDRAVREGRHKSAIGSKKG